MKFQIGEGLSCDLDRLVDSRLQVQANSGGGKSWLLRRLLEQTHGNVQHLVIDYEGEFASLREKFDYVHAAKSGGDTAAEPRSAAMLAERLLELKASAILDIYELATQRVRFVRLFLEALVNARKELWHPVLVVVDEAHIFCPEAGEAESAEAVKLLASLGRKRGFCAVLATQRVSKLSKDAAAECNNKLIGRATLDVDVKRAAAELGLSVKEAAPLLRQLKPGEFFAYGPAFMGEVNDFGVMRVTVGDVQTTHPKAGGHRKFTAPPPTAAIKALLPKLEDLPAEAEKRYETMASLEHALRQAKRDLAAAKRAAPATETKTIERFVLKDGQLARAEKLVDRMEKVRAEFWKDVESTHAGFRLQLEALAFEANAIKGAIAQTKSPASEAAPRASAPLPTQPAASPGGTNRGSSRATVRPAAGPGDGALGAGELKILSAIAQHADGVDREQLTVLTGYKRSSRDTYLQRLGAKGYIGHRGGTIHVTDDGIAALGSRFEPLPVGAELRDYWLNRLGGGEQKILSVLAGYDRGEWVSRDSLSEQTAYQRSSRDTYLQRLGARKLIETSREGVRLADLLFD